MSERILVVEDDAKIASVLVDYLQSNGFETAHESRGDAVEQAVRDSVFSLVILDIALPGLDGIEVCKRLRSSSSVPIVMLTARADETDRVLGLELGADDYICKPFSPREVVARVKAVLRRGPAVSARPDTRVVIDDEACRASVDGHDLDLTVVEFRLLQSLAAHPGRILSRAQLMDSMYPDYRVVSDRTVDSHVKKLRRKLARRITDGEVIHSIYGLGYKYEA